MPFVLSRTARSAALGAPRQAAPHRSCGNDPRGRRTAVAPHGCGQGGDGSGRPAAARKSRASRRTAHFLTVRAHLHFTR